MGVIRTVNGRSDASVVAPFTQLTARKLRRWTVAALMSLTSFTLAGVAGSADIEAIIKILNVSDDFRVRADAAGKLATAATGTGSTKARKALENALTDLHPTVRQAAASALGHLGDAAAITVLETAASREKNPPTKTSMLKAANDLKSAGAAPDWAKTKYLVQVESVSNGTGVRGTALSRVAEGYARSRLATTPGVLVLPSSPESAALMATGGGKGLPVFSVHAGITTLDQKTVAGDVKISAKVSITLSRAAVIRVSLDGAASSVGSGMTAKNPDSLARLQDMAVEGAMTSALSDIPTALKAAAK